MVLAGCVASSISLVSRSRDEYAASEPTTTEVVEGTNVSTTIEDCREAWRPCCKHTPMIEIWAEAEVSREREKFITTDRKFDVVRRGYQNIKLEYWNWRAAGRNPRLRGISRTSPTKWMNSASAISLSYDFGACASLKVSHIAKADRYEQAAVPGVVEVLGWVSLSSPRVPFRVLA